MKHTFWSNFLDDLTQPDVYLGLSRGKISRINGRVVSMVQCCQQYCSALLHPIQAQQYCSILLTTMNNVGSTTLSNPVFIKPEQVDNFLPCIHAWKSLTCHNYIVVNRIEQCFALVAQQCPIWLVFLGPVVRKVDSAIYRIVIFSTVVKMLQKLHNYRYRTHNLWNETWT